MTDYRQQAIKDVSKALKLDAEILARQMDIDPLCLFNSAPSNVYAVAQREARLRLEDALRRCMNDFNMTRLIMPPDASKQAAELIAEYRAILNAVKEGEKGE